MSLTLSYPTEYLIQNDIFQKMKKALRDESIFSASDITVMFAPDAMFVWSGTSSHLNSSGTYYLNDEEKGTFETDSDGYFRFQLGLEMSGNKVSVSLSGEHVSKRLVAYNVALWTTLYATYIKDWNDEFDQFKQSVHIADGDSLTTPMDDLYFFHGSWVQVRPDDTMTRETYRDFLDQLFESMNKNCQLEGIRQAIYAITEETPIVREWNRMDFFNFDPCLDVEIVGGIPSLNYAYEGGPIILNNTRYHVLGGSGSVGADSTTWLYCDGDNDANGYATVKTSTTVPSGTMYVDWFPIATLVSNANTIYEMKDGYGARYLGGIGALEGDAIIPSVERDWTFEVELLGVTYTSGQKYLVREALKLLRPAAFVYVKFGDEGYFTTLSESSGVGE